MERIIKLVRQDLKNKSLKEKIDYLNKLKIKLHNISPFKNEPTDCVIWVKNEKVIANDYNPNAVAPPEMELLSHSILSDGFTQPIVSFIEKDKYTVIDGFHRNRVGKENKEVNKRIKDYLPLTLIRREREGRNNRIASTIRHNRARGKHSIEGMSEIIVELKRRNWTDKKIGKELGMEPDEVLRLAQITGLRDMFKDKEFSEAWEADVIMGDDELEVNKKSPKKGGLSETPKSNLA